MGKTRRHMKNMKAQTHKNKAQTHKNTAQTHKNKAQTHKNKAQTHKKKHTGRKHRRNHTRKMSGGIFSIKRRWRERGAKKAIKKDEKRKIKEIKEGAAIKESKQTGYLVEEGFPPRPRLPRSTYNNLNELNRLKHQYAEAVPPSKVSYASIASKSSPHYASVGPPSKASYARVEGDSATPYENESSRPNPNDVYAVVDKNRRVILGADGNIYREEHF
jgi:hypothetical protein